MNQGRTQGPSVRETMPKDPRAFLQQAEEHRRAGRHQEAIAVCLEGLSRHPGLDAARVTLGRAYLESGQMEPARHALQNVFSRLPDHHLAGKLLAETLRPLGDFKAAAEACHVVLTHYPRDREIEAVLASLPQTAEAGAAPPPPAILPPTVPAVAARPAAVAKPATVAQPRTAARPAASQPAPADPAPDYFPEDVATAGAPAQRPDVLETNTLAELYLRQGLHERALHVYRGMLRVDPANDAIRRRLGELETAAAGTKAPAVPVMTPPAAEPPATRAAAAPSSDIAPAMTHERRVIERLSGWLAVVQSASRRDGGSTMR